MYLIKFCYTYNVLDM